MLKQVDKKKKPFKFEHPDATTEPVVCGACHYQRKPTDTNPEWQCPGCGVAYNKIRAESEPENLSRQEEIEKDIDYLRGLRKGPIRDSKDIIKSGYLAGAATFFGGLSKTVGTCVKVLVPANPYLMFAGAAIIAATTIYALFKYFG